MGGNFRTNDVEAQRIYVTPENRSIVANNISSALKIINTKFCDMFGVPLWNEFLILSNGMFSGSSSFLFSPNISNEEFASVKPSMGDIDVQVDIKHSKDIEELFKKIEGEDLGLIKLIGWKESVGQYVTLWYIENPKEFVQFVQIDFETVEFENNVPTDWARFSRSSNWDDLKVEIKGVTHKWLIQSICALDNTPKVILTGKTQKPKETHKSAMTFSVTHGIRDRFIPLVIEAMSGQEIWNHNVWEKHAKGKFPEWDGLYMFKEIPTSESTFYTNPKDIFKKLFGYTPGADELISLYSFRGMCNLIGRYFEDKDIIKIADDLANRMWGPEAQEIVRWDAERDFNEKLPALSWYCTRFCIDLNKYKSLAFSYYSTFGNRKD